MLNENQFINKIILITGSSQGIGKELAVKFADKKAKLIINYSRSASKALNIFKTIKKLSPDSILIKADVSKLKEVEKMFKKIIQKFGRVDILINNAGIVCEHSNFLKTSQKEWQRTIDVNLTGTYNCLRTAAPYFLKQRKGKILNISSLRSLYGASDIIAYSASKAGVDNLTKSFAKIFGADIMVNSLLLGRMNLGMSQTSDSKKNLVDFNKFFNQVATLVSDKSKLTGQIITGLPKKISNEI